MNEHKLCPSTQDGQQCSGLAGHDGVHYAPNLTWPNRCPLHFLGQRCELPAGHLKKHRSPRIYRSTWEYADSDEAQAKLQCPSHFNGWRCTWSKDHSGTHRGPPPFKNSWEDSESYELRCTSHYNGQRCSHNKKHQGQKHYSPIYGVYWTNAESDEFAVKEQDAKAHNTEKENNMTKHYDQAEIVKAAREVVRCYRQDIQMDNGHVVMEKLSKFFPDYEKYLPDDMAVDKAVTDIINTSKVEGGSLRIYTRGVAAGLRIAVDYIRDSSEDRDDDARTLAEMAEEMEGR